MDFLIANGSAILFYLFSGVAVACAILVVTMRNPMYGAISLLGTFVSIAGLFLLRHAEFIAVVQIFVYAGGVMVLFLFVIMLVNLHQLHESRMFVPQLPWAAIVGVALVVLVGGALLLSDFAPADAAAGGLTAVDGEALGNSEAVAWLLYREYFLPFEIASVFLLVAMIGAVVLGRRA